MYVSRPHISVPADEGHVFTHQESLSRALKAEFYFFAKVFNFTSVDIVSDVSIGDYNPCSSLAYFCDYDIVPVL